MVDAYERLSDESRYRRFLSPHKQLTDAELRYFTEVDHHDHEALVAGDPESGEWVGVARYVRSPAVPESAEVAVTVIDDWHGCGVGTRLTMELAKRALEEGVTTFTAVVLSDNAMMLNLLGDLGDVRIVSRDGGTVELAVELSQTGIDHLRRLLKVVATGEIRPLARHERPQSGRDA